MTTFPSSARGLTLLAAAALVLPSAADAQQATPVPPPEEVSLEEAIELALRHNPAYRSEVNDIHLAEWDVREAWGALLPGASANAGFQYQAEGEFRLGSLTGSELGVGTTPSSYLSDYFFGFDYYLDGATIARVGLQRSRLTAAAADARAAAIGLAAQVKSQYVTALGAQDAHVVSQREVELAEENLELARARVEIGAAPALEVTQAEVALGRAQVELLTTENDALNEKLVLLRLMGVDMERDVELTSEFEVFEPAWSTEELIDLAMAQHPQLRALRANRDAGAAGVRAAKLTYLPSLQMSAGWSGFAREVSDEGALIDSYRQGLAAQIPQCEAINVIFERLTPPLSTVDCASVFAPDPTDESRLLAENDVFPFRFQDQPFIARAQVSLPIFQGFRRQGQVEEAQVIADDARYALRAQELQLTGDVIAANRTLETAYRAVQIEARNQQLADQQLELARERYRLGALSYIDLSESTTLKARADRAYLASVYAFHQALAALEAAVGRPLTTSTPENE
ncbi:MAG TPA: TolC family protein [Longimicrobiales bacterium]|nr:TolC family protein [Longimicrobiales bacterium]